MLIKLRRLRLFCSSSVPDPAKDETGELGNHSNNSCDNIVNDVKNFIEDIAWAMQLMLETNRSITKDK